jgi:hypothetical protein
MAEGPTLTTNLEARMKIIVERGEPSRGETDRNS